MKDYIESGDLIKMENRRLNRGRYKNMESIVANVSDVKGDTLEISIYGDNNGAKGSYVGKATMSQIEGILCSECIGEKIYHDRKDDYICPFCEL